MTKRGDLLLLFIKLKHKTALEYVLFMKAIRSTFMMKYFVKEWQIHCCSWRESWTTSAFDDFQQPENRWQVGFISETHIDDGFCQPCSSLVQSWFDPNHILLKQTRYHLVHVFDENRHLGLREPLATTLLVVCDPSFLFHLSRHQESIKANTNCSWWSRESSARSIRAVLTSLPTVLPLIISLWASCLACCSFLKPSSMLAVIVICILF